MISAHHACGRLGDADAFLLLACSIFGTLITKHTVSPAILQVLASNKSETISHEGPTSGPVRCVLALVNSSCLVTWFEQANTVNFQQAVVFGLATATVATELQHLAV